ncbi:MAG: alpha/beta fold hydrolase [Streptosporangiales bacterium]|nr:alpha/beta fold hydrolase [Streptosporangiales bacterium]
MQYFPGRDGTQLAYREVGEGRPLVLIHGYFSTATVNWIKYGHAAAIAARGHRVIMPDLRGHGDSGKPHDKAAYPPDVLADDGFALLEHLGLDTARHDTAGSPDYDLGGYSLGGRTTVRMLIRGATPGRAIVAGMGLEAITATAERTDFFHRVFNNLGTFERGTAEWRAEAFLKTVGGDPVALLNVIETSVDTPLGDIEKIETPMAAVMGTEDLDHGSPRALAAALPGGTYVPIPGNHMSAVTKPELGTAIADFLG